MKQTWKNPQLQILTRTGSEETVLVDCKWNVMPTSGPGDSNARCDYTEPACAIANCDTLVSS